MKFSYQSKCFSEARSALQLPFEGDEDVAIGHAFHLCSRALDKFHLKRELLKDEPSVLQWIEVVERTMNTAGLEDPDGIGTWRVKARSLSMNEQGAFSSAVGELAAWFDMQFWSSSK